MKIIKKDLKTGLLVAQTENLDDLWYLSQIINEGDLVKAKTTRLVKSKDEKLRAEKGQKQSMVLSIRVKKVEFDSNSNRLRILGEIAAGPEDLIALGSYHTLEIGENDTVEMFKERWSAHELKYIQDAEKAAKAAKIMICIIGDGEATIALVRERGLRYVDVRENLGGKYVKGRDEKKKEFYEKLLELLKEQAEAENIRTIILGGPGFEKKNFLDYARGKLNMQVVDTGSEGKAGVNEILRGGALERVISEARIARESRLVERLLEGIAKGGMVAYGEKEVAEAVDMGAVDILLVLDRKLRGNRKKIEVLIDKAKQAGAEFHVLNSEFEPGQRLEGLGGVAAVLRYKV